MNNTDLLKVMENNHQHIVTLIEATKTAINAETKASADMLDMKIEQVKTKQDITNGRVVCLETETFNTSVFKKAMKYKLIGVVAIAVILAIVVHEFGLLELLNIIK